MLLLETQESIQNQKHFGINHFLWLTCDATFKNLKKNLSYILFWKKLFGAEIVGKKFNILIRPPDTWPSQL